MSGKRKTLELASQQFYKFEKWILAESKLKKLSPSAKLLYMVIRDREELSLKNAKDFTDKDLSTSEKVVLLYLIDKSNNTKIDITLKVLENELGMTRPTIMKAIKGLQEKQLVKKENNFNNGIITANTYKINLFKYN